MYIHLQVSEAGVHRPHVAGIAARENEGAFSIVLSGGYEDDVVSACVRVPLCRVHCHIWCYVLASVCITVSASTRFCNLLYGFCSRVQHDTVI